jgi:hypothetical protein
VKNFPVQVFWEDKRHEIWLCLDEGFIGKGLGVCRQLLCREAVLPAICFGLPCLDECPDVSHGLVLIVSVAGIG